MEKIKLAVYNEYALGYIMPERPDTFYTLKDSVLRGAPWRVMREPYFIGPQGFRGFRALVRRVRRSDVRVRYHPKPQPQNLKTNQL